MVGHEGLSAHIDLDNALTSDLVYNCSLGFFNVTEDGHFVDLDGEDPLAQFKMDASNMHKGMKQTSACITLPLYSTNPQSPNDTSQVTWSDFDDHLRSVRKVMGPTIKSFNDRMSQPRFELDLEGKMIWYKLRLYGGGDLSNITDMMPLPDATQCTPAMSARSDEKTDAPRIQR